MDSRRTWRVAGLAVVLHAVTVVWLTWPLAANLATRLPDTRWPCRYDPLLVGWALAHESRALVAEPASFGDGNAFHPSPHALFYGEAGFGALPLFLPVFLATGNPTLALNLVLVGGIVLTCAALHVVVQHTSGSQLGGLVAAWTFLATPWVLWTWLPVAPNYAVLFYLPVIALLAIARTRRAAILLGILVALQGLTSVYVAAAVVVPLGVLAAARVLRRGSRASGMRLAAVLGVAAVVWLGAYAGHLAVRVENPDFAAQTVWHGREVSPTRLPWDPLGRFAPTGVPLVALAVIAGGALLRRAGQEDAWRHAFLWAGVGAFASLTPVVRWGAHAFPLPQALLARFTPLYEVIRFPERLGVVGLVGLAWLAGLGFASLAARLPRSARPIFAGALAVALYAQYAYGVATPRRIAPGPLPARYPLSFPMPMQSPLVTAIAGLDGAVLELPVGPAHLLGSPLDAPFQANAMYRAIFHRRPLLNGYNGYWPVGFPERMVLARRLPEPAALQALRAETGLGVMLVHTGLFGVAERGICARLAADHPDRRLCNQDFGAAERAMWTELAARGGNGELVLVGRDGGDLLFRVRSAEP